MPADRTLPVLVVDDYATMTKIVRNLLNQIGFIDVDEVHDGNQALEKLNDKRYGLIISDWNMAPMTGYELLKAVRSNAQTAMTPFIMITAESKVDNVFAARKAGVNNYLVKPFSANTLKSKIDAIFQ